MRSWTQARASTDAAGPSGGLFLFELIDEIDEIEERPRALARMTAAAGSRSPVGLSRTGPADQDEIWGSWH